MAESYPNGLKTLWEREKLLVTSNFSLSHSVFKRFVSKGRQKVSMCGNGLIGAWGPIARKATWKNQYLDFIGLQRPMVFQRTESTVRQAFWYLWRLESQTGLVHLHVSKIEPKTLVVESISVGVEPKRIFCEAVVDNCGLFCLQLNLGHSPFVTFPGDTGLGFQLRHTLYWGTQQSTEFDCMGVVYS